MLGHTEESTGAGWVEAEEAVCTHRMGLPVLIHLPQLRVASSKMVSRQHRKPTQDTLIRLYFLRQHSCLTQEGDTTA